MYYLFIFGNMGLKNLFVHLLKYNKISIFIYITHFFKKIPQKIIPCFFPYPLSVFHVKILCVNFILFFSFLILVVRYYFVTLVPSNGIKANRLLIHASTPV